MRIFKKLLCAIIGHRWSSEWFGSNYYDKKRRYYEGTWCLRCKHPGIRYENGVRVPLLTQRGAGARNAPRSSAR